MFRRQNNNNKQQPGGKGPVNEIREEQEAEDALIKIGNEAAGTLAELPNPNSNEANNAIIDEDPLAHYKSQDLRDGPDHNNLSEMDLNKTIESRTSSMKSSRPSPKMREKREKNPVNQP